MKRLVLNLTKLLILGSIFLVGCREDSDLRPHHEDESAQSQVQAMRTRFEAQYKAQVLRSFNGGQQVSSSSYEIKPLWSSAQTTGPTSGAPTTIVPVNTEEGFFRYSETLDAQELALDIDKLTKTYLVQTSGTQGATIYLAQFVPDREWLKLGYPYPVELGKVPRDYSGSIDIRDLSHRLLGQIVYHKGELQGVYQALSEEEEPSSRLRSVSKLGNRDNRPWRTLSTCLYVMKTREEEDDAMDGNKTEVYGEGIYIVGPDGRRYFNPTSIVVSASYISGPRFYLTSLEDFVGLQFELVWASEEERRSMADDLWAGHLPRIGGGSSEQQDKIYPWKDPSKALKKICAPTFANNLDDTYKDQLAEAFEEMEATSLGYAVLAKLASYNIIVLTRVELDAIDYKKGLSSYSNGVLKLSKDRIEAQALTHELIHALQAKVYGKETNDWGNDRGFLEFECRLVMDIVHIIGRKGKSDEEDDYHYGISSNMVDKERENAETRYLDWLNDLTGKGSYYPLAIDSRGFIEYAKLFGTYNESYPQIKPGDKKRDPKEDGPAYDYNQPPGFTPQIVHILRELIINHNKQK